ncbi:DUF6114 domain-containing protein [Streptomyces lydicus]|uniref:DUF6114 domain-containing protein n=1 Tax=Streptomyces lydicus TaxID=47763 RepID=UPI0036C2B6C0
MLLSAWRRARPGRMPGRPTRRAALRRWRRTRPFWAGLLLLLGGAELVLVPFSPLTVLVSLGLGGLAALGIAGSAMGFGWMPGRDPAPAGGPGPVRGGGGGKVLAVALPLALLAAVGGPVPPVVPPFVFMTDVAAQQALVTSDLITADGLRLRAGARSGPGA